MKTIDTMSEQSGRVLGSGRKLGDDISFTFANSAAANTQVIQIIQAPENQLQAYKISIYNPSASSLMVKLMTIEEAFGGANRDCLMDTLEVPASATVTGTIVNAHEFLTGGIFCGGSLKIVASNNAPISESGGFSALIRIREV